MFFDQRLVLCSPNRTFPAYHILPYCKRGDVAVPDRQGKIHNFYFRLHKSPFAVRFRRERERITAGFGGGGNIRETPDQTFPALG